MQANEENSAHLDSLFDSYEWNLDKKFQAGLKTIVESHPQSERESLELRAKCFYFKR